MEQSKSERTKRLIVEKSAPIFNRHGYAGTSLSEIIDAVGLTKGAIYGNFADKDELALAALDYNFKAISDRIAEAVRAEENACDRLTAFARFYRDNFSSLVRTGGCPVLNAAVDSDDGNQAILRRVAGFLKIWMDTLSGIVRKGIEKNEIRTGTDPQNFATLFISLVEGGILLAKTTGKKEYLETAMDHIVEMVEGIRNG